MDPKTNSDNFKEIINLSKLLQNECIIEELEDFLRDFTVTEKEELKFSKSTSFLITNTQNEVITLILDDSHIYAVKLIDTYLSKTSKYNVGAEILTIDKNLNLIIQNIEKRENGIIVSILKKKFAPSKRFGYKTVLVDLYENRYTFDEEYFANVTKFGGVDALTIAKKILSDKEAIKVLEEKSQFSTQFSTHMNHLIEFDKGRIVKFNSSASTTYLNGEDISKTFDIIDGEDKLNRIYDLYKGIVNNRNKEDINSIKLGLLSPDAFDLKSLKGITEQEESIVGKSLIAEKSELDKTKKYKLTKNSVSYQ